MRQTSGIMIQEGKPPKFVTYAAIGIAGIPDMFEPERYVSRYRKEITTLMDASEKAKAYSITMQT